MKSQSRIKSNKKIKKSQPRTGHSIWRDDDDDPTFIDAEDCKSASDGDRVEFSWSGDPCEGVKYNRCRPIYFKVCFNIFYNIVKNVRSNLAKSATSQESYHLGTYVKSTV